MSLTLWDNNHMWRKTRRLFSSSLSLWNSVETVFDLFCDLNRLNNKHKHQLISLAARTHLIPKINSLFWQIMCLISVFFITLVARLRLTFYWPANFTFATSMAPSATILFARIMKWILFMFDIKLPNHLASIYFITVQLMIRCGNIRCWNSMAMFTEFNRWMP